MITPRTTRLLRVPDLRAMHVAIARLGCVDASSCAVLVPTRAAARELQRTLAASLANGARDVPFPDLLTRDELYRRLHRGLMNPPPLLSDVDREAMFRRSARAAAEAGTAPPFRVRAGLLVEMLAFYDELRRRDRTIADFERLMVSSLDPHTDIDRGADRMLRQTRFLIAAFDDFERRVAASGGIDEHGLRTLLLDPASASRYRHVITTVPDRTSDAAGLWLADYDLLARLPGLERLDVIATENVLAAGFHQRIHDVLPGIEEERESASPLPVLVAPDDRSADASVKWFVCRDREEELVELARSVGNRSPADAAATAVVFQRPLPYLYLARQVFGDAGLPYRAVDALPLAAEPFAAALDLVFSFAVSEGTRASIVAMLSSPHWVFERDGRAVTASDVADADDFLLRLKYHGGWERLSHIAGQADCPFALLAVSAAAEELRTGLAAPAASEQLAALLSFVAAHERPATASDSWHARHAEAREAILDALRALAEAHRRHDDDPLALAEIIAGVRRWIEGRTFAPVTGSDGVAMLDARAAAYADVAEVRLVGMVDTDWPEAGGRSIFYPGSLLVQLGWPAEGDRVASARARFQDLLTLAASRVSVSTFTLEDDSLVSASPFLEDVDAAGLLVERAPRTAPPALLHETLWDGAETAPVSGEAADWLALRRARSPVTAASFHGQSGARGAATYAVSRVERYLDCPFKYFAAHVLRLPEERDDESGLTPRERGQLLHDVFHAFFDEWHRSGGRAINPSNIADALAMFERVADEKLAALSEADRALERTHLLGSAAASGLAERAFAFEVEQGAEIVERLLEYELDGEFEFAAGGAPRRVRLRAKADRIDLLDDGTVRVVDYKLSRAPKPARALQLPIYGVCAQQRLRGRHGRTWTLARAGYIAFREKNAFVALGASSSLEEALVDGQRRLLAAIDGIEAGAFPPDPDEPFMCTRCAYPTVCRKDYVGDE